MSYPYHQSTGQPDPNNNNPGFYGSQTPYQYHQQRGGNLDMNMAYGHHGYNNTDNVANTSNEFPRDTNGNENINGFPLGANGNNDNYPQDTKVNVANPEEGNVVGYASVMDILNQLNESDGNIPENSTNDEPPAVPPFSSGEGLPYAPENWPNPGDKWSWRVGRRVKTSGIYIDRFLYLPKSYVGFNTPKQPFASKPTVERYIAENFPGADINAFFATFSWDIRSTEPTPSKGLKPAASGPTVIPEPSTDRTGTQIIEEAPTFEVRGKRKAAIKAAANMIAPPYSNAELDGRTDSEKSRKGKRKALTDYETSPKPRSSGRPKKPKVVPDEITPQQKTTAPKRKFRQPPSPTTNGAIQVREEEPSVDPVEFDKYLSSLDDIIAQPNYIEMIEPNPINVFNAQTDISGHEIMQARIKLSSLLNMEDFPSLFQSKKLQELTNLVSKIRKDPTLTAEQLVKLKLVEEIPMYSEVYLENKEIAEQALKFFALLADNKVKIATMKDDYSGLKEQSSQIQTEIDYSQAAVQEIDEQIALLHSQRDRLTASIKDKNKKKSELISVQNSLANSIPKVVQEIQLANAKTLEWELKKKNAAKREEEILERFLCLRGFVL